MYPPFPENFERAGITGYSRHILMSRVSPLGTLLLDLLRWEGSNREHIIIPL